MKRLISVLALLFLGGLASGLKASCDPAVGTDLPITGTKTYLFASSLTGSVSAVVTMTAQMAGMIVNVTGTATGVDVQWSVSNNAQTSLTSKLWSTGCTIPMASSQFVRKQANYVRFVVSQLSHDVATATLNYQTVDAAPASGSNGQGVSLTPGTNYIGAVGITNTVVPQWTILNVASYTLTGTVQLNLTATAGSSGVMKYKFTALGANAGFYHCTAPNATWVGPLGYYAVSTTPIIDDNLAAGTHLLLSATAAAVTVTVQVEISKLSTVAP